MLRHKGMAQRAIWVRFICIAWIGMVMQAGVLSAALVGPAVEPGHPGQRVAYTVIAPLSSNQRVQFQLAAAEPDDGAVDKAKVKEIMGYQDEDRKTRHFIEYVMFPLGLFLVIIMVIRGAFVK